MPDLKISQLNAITEPSADDLLVLANDPSGSAETVKVTRVNIGKKIVESSAKTSNYNLTVSDEIIKFDCTASELIAYLPSAVGLKGKQYTLFKIDSTSNKLSILPAGAENINGNSSRSILFQYSGSTFISDNNNWLVINESNKPNIDDTIYACDSGVSVNDVVYWDGAALQKSDKANGSTVPFLGIVRSKPSSTTANLQFIGERNGFSGITPNLRYYLGTAGATTSTVTTTSGEYIVPVGIGKNSSTIELRFSPYMVRV